MGWRTSSARTKPMKIRPKNGMTSPTMSAILIARKGRVAGLTFPVGMVKHAQVKARLVQTIELDRTLIHIAAMGTMKSAKFAIGQVVRHRIFPFRGVVFDVDPEFNNTEEWYQATPAEVRPRKDQPFYHLLAENSDSQYIAYVSEQNLLDDSDGEPPQHPQLGEL